MIRSHRPNPRSLFPCIVLCLVSGALAQGKFQYAPAPADNPLKGLVPYVHADGVDRFPHSLEFHYFPLNALMTGPDTFDFSPLEKYLNTAKQRGCQLIVRVYLEYPGKKSAIPRHLIDAGLKVVEWDNPNSKRKNITPDYEDPRLRNAIKRFIGAFGKKYDGDPRLGFITAGLLGSWGEWHTYPREDLWASKATQNAVLDAYEAAFQKTPVLLRYPAGPKNSQYTHNATKKFGYHDDSFAWATLDTGEKKDSWYFMPLLKNAGALSQWQTQPIGGEIRPELWKTSFTDPPHPKAQNFVQCVQQTHATWLMDSGLFDKNIPLPPKRKQRAIEQVRRLGYEFHIAAWRVHRNPNHFELEIDVENRGVAPFYADWPVDLMSVPGPQGPADQLAVFKLTGILPGAKVTWRAKVDREHLGREIQLGVRHPMREGKPLRFANREQKGDVMILGKLTNRE